MTHAGYVILPMDCQTAMQMCMAPKSVHTVVTSPPYFGLRDYGVDGQIGLEPTPDEFVAALVDVFRDVRRVLRDDGTVWLNLGDSYAGSGKGVWNASDERKSAVKETYRPSINPVKIDLPDTIKHKDLIGIPWRVALALQADGWYLRQDIIWHKPNPMPESVTDRCTKAHEYIFLLTKQPRYYFDNEAIKEMASTKPGATWKDRRSAGAQRGNLAFGDNIGAGTQRVVHGEGVSHNLGSTDGKRNRRSVWTVTTKPFKGAHFATFPPDLIEPCILAGCPQYCCDKCGAPHKSKYTRDAEQPDVEGSDLDRFGTGDHGVHRKVGGQYQKWLDANPKRLTGYEPICKCDSGYTSGTVFDPFGGSGTTALVALKHGRNAILTELNPEYVEMAHKRIGDSK